MAIWLIALVQQRAGGAQKQLYGIDAYIASRQLIPFKRNNQMHVKIHIV